MSDLRGHAALYMPDEVEDWVKYGLGDRFGMSAADAVVDELKEYHKCRIPIPPTNQVRDALKKMMEEREQKSSEGGEPEKKEQKEGLLEYMYAYMYMYMYVFCQLITHPLSETTQ